ncbi:unnamed protein product [Rotaria magnacalcarata]|uniref:RING-type domain-containing protein n=3 Tax=Rotaria magnacalcarata TaxID=392030 RepID=A0A817ARJ2_9BILA|nr:unnamed protein product [Rotaria magnacalcarata]CAF2270525.1 unnamed protein product [Rotaria magnacalcarata]CAF3977019.1 unnamed protein product [Rotaria magnacalcarata]CAF4326044.1 unnamed protein product [Rotaria magnacalcarata]
MAQRTVASTTTSSDILEENDDISYEDCIDIEAAESEKDNEIVCLRPTDQSKWLVTAGNAYEQQWNKATKEDDTELAHSNDVFVISILGGTAVGKSFISQHFFGENEKKPQTVEDSDLLSSTTGNINCFECTKMTEVMCKTLVLDYEGENGTSKPLMLRARRWKEKLQLSDFKNLLAKRSEAVSEYFPKIAYILSNIVIFVAKFEFVDSHYLTRCCEFAQRANQGVSQVPILPVLIIIENKCSLTKKFGINEVTNEFFTINQHSQKLVELKKYFSQIYCIRLPPVGTFQKVKGKLIEGEKIFNEQITELKQKFSDIYTEHRKRLITHPQWLFLLERVLEIVSHGHSVSMHNLLAEITETGEEYEQIAKKLFLSIYSQKSVHSVSWYKNCRLFAMKVLARSLAVKFLKQEDIISRRVIHDQCAEKLVILWKILDEFTPCEAAYPNHRALGTSTPITCFQHKGAHSKHRTSELFGGNRFLTFLGQTLFSVVWEGNFESSEPETPSESVFDQFTSMTMDYLKSLKESKEARYVSLKNLLEEYRVEEKMIGALPARMCPCCLEKRLFGRFPIRRIVLYERTPFCRRCTNEIDELSWAEPFKTESNKEHCVRCKTAKRDHCLLPCGHRGFCLECATRIQTESGVCLKCNRKVESVLKVQDI